MKYFLAEPAKHKARVHQIDFIGEFLQAKVKNRVFVKLDMRYADYFPEYAQDFVRALKLLKSMYGMTNSGKPFADEMTEWLIEEFLCNHIFICQSTIIIHLMDPRFFYLMLMIVSTGIRMKILENGFLTPW